MKWAFFIQQKVRVAFLLGFIMILVGLTTWQERKNILQMDQSFSSIYHDRLIPAVDIFYLTQNLYTRQLLMEQYLYTDHNFENAELKEKLNGHSENINKLIAKFAGTELVEKESKYLDEFQRHVLQYNKIESEILTANSKNSENHSRELYEGQGRKVLAETIGNLEQLANIQSSEGNAIMHTSKGVLSNSDLILTLQICVAITIGLMVQALIVASKSISTKKQNFHMN
jgi:hypothetical protein